MGAREFSRVNTRRSLMKRWASGEGATRLHRVPRMKFALHEPPLRRPCRCETLTNNQRQQPAAPLVHWVHVQYLPGQRTRNVNIAEISCKGGRLCYFSRKKSTTRARLLLLLLLLLFFDGSLSPWCSFCAARVSNPSLTPFNDSSDRDNNPPVITGCSFLFFSLAPPFSVLLNVKRARHVTFLENMVRGWLVSMR